MTLVILLPDEQQNLERASLIFLHSNVRSFCQAYCELSRTCLTLHPALICLTETHLFHDATDTICQWRSQNGTHWGTCPINLVLCPTKKI